MAILSAVQTGSSALGAVTGIINKAFGAKPHDMCPSIPFDNTFYGAKGLIKGISDDASWPIHNRFVQAKELDGGTSWSCDNKKTWIWLYTCEAGPFSIEDKSASNMQSFVNKLKAYYAQGLIPDDYDVGVNYKRHVVEGNDKTFAFLDKQVEQYKKSEPTKTALASFTGVDLGEANKMWLMAGAGLLLVAFLFRKG